MSLEARQLAEREILRLKDKTALPLKTLLGYAGIPQRTWREWAGRRGRKTRHNNNIPKAYYLTPDEDSAIAAYCAENPLKGYRMQCWEMVDRNVAFVCPAQAYIT